MKFFPRRKPRKRDLQGAISLIDCAMEIIWRYQRDKDYMPTQVDLRQFERVASLMQENTGAAHYIHRCLKQRAAGRPEGAKKFTDSDVMDWHYPP
ncbi:MAG: hypothetical protein P8P30_07390 [Rickettsiales bacterium]|nr:hypothetical protein [Rickettsiales bacterium]